MVLIQWLERGLGQILAPDENYKPKPDVIDTQSEFWQLVAPDPNFGGAAAAATATASSTTTTTATTTATTTNASAAAPVSSTTIDSPLTKNAPGLFSPSPAAAATLIGNSGICPTCHQPLPAAAASNKNNNDDTPLLRTPTAGGDSSNIMSHCTPGTTTTTTSTTMDPSSDLNSRVLTAAQCLATSMASPAAARKKADSVFRWCASSISINDSIQRKLRKMLEKNPDLIQARCAKMGQLCPDGYTPMMAAAYSNNQIAAEILWELGQPDQLLETNLQGKTAYHIAAENGNMECLDYFKQKFEATYGLHSPPPMDLTGMTPLGVAVTSPLPKAQKQRKALHDKLFSPNDPSILGSPAPIPKRITHCHGLQIVYGVSQMPGKRILMEDSSVASAWDTAALFAVCDGHSDNGQVSKFVAESFPSKFQAAIRGGASSEDDDNAVAVDDWNLLCREICLSTDARLRKASIPGGSTAVVAVVTKTQIVCANVGDSRCILIHSATEEERLSQETQEKLSLKEGEEKPPSSPFSAYKVTPMSIDHKANTDEEVNRIENAGLKVIEEKFQENGKEICITKVELSNGNRMACSRAFGDFEYKMNDTLNEDEQAVVAVPEVIVRDRDAATDAYLVLACDGIWDVMNNDEVGMFVVEAVESSLSADETSILPAVGDKLLNECLARGSDDNLSVIIVALTKTAEKLAPASGLEGKALDFAAAKSTVKK